MDLNTLGNILGFICILLYALFFCLPAFMLIWEEDLGGCYGIVCLFIGFPGALLAGLIKIPIAIKEAKKEKKEAKKENERLQNKYDEGKSALDNGNYSCAKGIFEELGSFRDSAALAHKAEQLHNAKEAANEKKRHEHYNKLRTAIYPNSERMMELLGIINSSSLPPHTIEIKYDAVTIYFEDKTKTYNFLSRGFEKLYQQEQDAFADALCAKLKFPYEKSEMKKFHERTNLEDWDFSVWSEHLGYQLVLKPTRRD